MTIREIMTLAPVIPVLTIENEQQAVPLAKALVAGGLKALEITLRTPVAAAVAAGDWDTITELARKACAWRQ